MVTPRPFANGIVYRDSWLFVRDNGAHRRPTGPFGYYEVPPSQATVALNWNQVYNHYLSFVHLDDVPALIGAYPLNIRAFHLPVVFEGLGSVREFAPIYVFAPWFDEGATIERPEWLQEHLSADGFFGGGMAVSHELGELPIYERAMSLRTSDVAQGYLREPEVYLRALFLQAFFLVRRPPADGESIVGLCDEWLT